MGQIDPLLATLPQETLDLVTPVGERPGLLGRQSPNRSLGHYGRLQALACAGPAQGPFRSSQKCQGVAVLGIEGKNGLGTLTHNYPIELGDRLFHLIQKTIDLPFKPLACHVNRPARPVFTPEPQ